MFAHPFQDQIQYHEQQLAHALIEISLTNLTDVGFQMDLSSMTYLYKRAQDLLMEGSCSGIVFKFSGSFESLSSMELIRQGQDRLDFKKRLFEILHLMNAIDKLKKPVFVLFDQELQGLSFVFALNACQMLAIGPQAKVGFPDGAFGLLLGCGGVINLKERVSLSTAFEVLTKGKLYAAPAALAWNLIDHHVASGEQAMAIVWQHVVKGMPVKKPISEFDPQALQAEFVKINKQTNPHIPLHISCFIIFKTSEFLLREELLLMELLQFEYVLMAKETLSMIRTLDYAVTEAKRYQAIQPCDFQMITVLGAGMMGSGIAFESAKAGIQTWLKDRDMAAAEKGKAYSTKVSGKLIQLGMMDQVQQETLLAHIHPITSFEGLPPQDLVIEAVFEDADLKAAVIQESLLILKDAGFYASNTTSLPITGLAKSSKDPSRFIGLHFFSPVDRMTLVEVIRGKETSAETLDQALQLVLKLNKVPIVVQDGPAFFTSRIFFSYLLEGITLLLEGLTVSKVEFLAKDAGFAVGPLAVLDEISLDLMVHVYDQLPHLNECQKRAYDYLKNMIAQGRQGRKAGKGFYDYGSPELGKIAIEDLTKAEIDHPLQATAIKHRLLHAVSLESYRCLEEGILNQPADGDMGSILGIGYAVHTGGVFSHIDQYGIQNFVQDCQNFQSFGDQWNVPASLQALALQHFKFYTGFQSQWPVRKAE